ncbi:orotidine-5'-phosphate decarboxylase [Alsobacter sp. KACC 23698]|uniref:Orotidine 5'-phosphate decarboxylase n=1 Tax=Alsobacter sp. KACC 23698 TaxID=3149229 RepID=A0AAU7JGJ5_9HYPH
MTGAQTPRDRMIVALDLPSVAEAQAMTERLGDSVAFYKVGLELIYAGGLDFAKRLIGEGKKVFLDLKFHDIPNTVTRATEQIARLGATYLTVHAYPQTMRAAVAASQGSGLKILAVTVMTSYDDADLAEAGYGLAVKDLVARRARQARDLGAGGLILSPEELAAIRPLVGPGVDLVTPGIRPAGAALGDQKRAASPAAAIRAGADALVVGRPITQAADPRAAADAIVAEIAGAL